MAMDALDLELYKTLKHESAAYNEKLQGLWLQKLTLSGALAAFIILQPDELTAVQPFSPIVVGFALLVALAVTIDLKVLEYGLHLSAISQFIARSFAESPRATDWEATLWGGGQFRERPLVLWRSALTVFSAALPTLALIVATTWLFGRDQRLGPAWALGPLAIGGYLAVLLLSAWAVLRGASLRR